MNVQFLQGVLTALETTEAPHCAHASHKASNAWYKAFHNIYGGIAADCTIPTGKNRYHKFKDKIVEIWLALEGEESHNLKDQGMRQLTTWRRAMDAKAIEVPDSPAGLTTKKGAKRASSGSAGGRPAKKMAHGMVAPAWAHLEEGKVLNESIPEPLRSLVHLRALAYELTNSDSTMIEDQYQTQLNVFLETPIVDMTPEGLFAHSQAIAVLWRCAKKLGKHAEAKSIQLAYSNTSQQYAQSLAGGSAVTV